MEQSTQRGQSETSERTLLQRVREVSLLKELSLFPLSGVRETSDLLAYRFAMLTKARLVRVFFTNQACTKARLAAGFNLGEGSLEAATKRGDLAFEDLPCGEAVLRQAPVTVSDITTDSDFSRWFDVREMLGLHGYAAVPLLAGGRVMGSVDFFYENVKSFSDQDLDLMCILANAGGLAVENALLFERMERASIIDEETGAYNQRHFVETLKKELARAKRYCHPLTLILMQMQEQPGAFEEGEGSSLQGGETLRQFLTGVKATIRGSDMLFRYREDIFCLILPQTRKGASAEIVASRIYDAFRETVGAERDLKVRVAGMDEDGDDVDTLLRAALG